MSTPAQIASPYSYKVVGTARDGSEIRKFGDDQVARNIDAAIASANLKVDQNAAVVVTYQDPGDGSKGSIRGAVMVRKDVGTLFRRKIDFTFVGVLTHDLGTGNTRKEVGAVIRL
jgi:hypothetical protein